MTICTLKHGYYFEKYPELEKIAQKNLLEIYKYFENIEIKSWVIMPNHIHFIIAIKYQVKEVTLGKIIAVYKSIVVVRWLKVIKNHRVNSIGSIWQRNYFEHIIRNKRELDDYIKYIEDNPKNWLNDSYHVSVK